MPSPELWSQVSEGSALLYTWPGLAHKVQDPTRTQLYPTLTMQPGSSRSAVRGTTLLEAGEGPEMGHGDVFGDCLLAKRQWTGL